MESRIDSFRRKSDSYAKPTKVDIAKYTLASYSQYCWDYVLIRYEVDNFDDYSILDSYILDLFPDAIIIHNRSDSFESFQESLKIINSFDDNWIFYAGNNDQPWIGADEKYIDNLMLLANRFEEKFDYVSIPYTHYSEFLNLDVRNTPTNLLYGRDVVAIEENDEAKVILRKQGDNTSAQIVNKKLLNFWFSTKKYPNRRIIRSEDVRNLFLTKNQLMIIPKREICAHFDGYLHTLGKFSEISNYQVPPLLIPEGFFTNNIKIRYGYDEYKKGWLNINPANSKYIFESRSGADLKIGIDEIPSFWRDRVAEIDINRDVTTKILEHAIARNNEIVKSPWKLKNKNFSIKIIPPFIFYFLFFIFVRLGLINIIYEGNEIRSYLKLTYLSLKRYKARI